MSNIKLTLNCRCLFNPETRTVDRIEVISGGGNLPVAESPIPKIDQKSSDENQHLKNICKLFTKEDMGEKLHEIIKDTGDIDLIKCLLELGADPYALSSILKKTPLYYALKHERYEIAEILIKNGVDVNKVINGRQIIFDLIDSKYIDQLKFLLKNGLDLNVSSEDHDKIVPIGLAAYSGKLDIVKLFVEHNADINKCNHYNQSPLYLSMANKHHNIMKFLIRSGANINAKTCGYPWGRETAPLGIAAIIGNYKMAKFLLKNGATVTGDCSPLSEFYVSCFIEQIKKQIAEKESKKTVETPVSIPEKTNVLTPEKNVVLETQTVVLEAKTEQKTPEPATTENKSSSLCVDHYIKTVIPINGKSFPYKGKISDISEFIKTMRELTH